MSNWITLTDADVRLLDTERATIDALSPDVDLASIVESAANLARGYIGRKFSLAAAPQVPPEVKNAVLAIAIAEYLGQVPGAGELLTDGRKNARDQAYKLLKDIAAGAFAVTPADTVAQTGSSIVETEQEGNSGNSRDDLKGL